MSYNPVWQPSRDLLRMATEVNSGNYTESNIATRLHLGIKFIGEITKIQGYLPQIPQEQQEEYVDDIQVFKNACSNLDGSDIPYSNMFKNITTDDSLSKHPYVRMLQKSLDSGQDFDRAVNNISDYLHVPTLAIKNFVKDNKLDYPTIDLKSKEFSLGQRDGRETTYGNLVDQMYQKAAEHQIGDQNALDNYVAGFRNSVGPIKQELRDEELLKLTFKNSLLKL